VAAASPPPAAVRVIFLGPPGAGKGTQAARLAARLGVPKIGTGEMLRSAIAKGTPLGEQVHPYMDEGNLVPDELLVALVRERIAQPDCGAGSCWTASPARSPRRSAWSR
jgi:adenylate kinase